MRDAPTASTAYRPQSFIALDVVLSVFRVTGYLDSAELVVSPYCPETPAYGTIATSRTLRYRRQLDPDIATMASSYQHEKIFSIYV